MRQGSRALVSLQNKKPSDAHYVLGRERPPVVMRFGVVTSILFHLAIVGGFFLLGLDWARRDVSAEPSIPLATACSGVTRKKWGRKRISRSWIACAAAGLILSFRSVSFSHSFSPSYYIDLPNAITVNRNQLTSLRDVRRRIYSKSKSTSELFISCLS